VVSGSNADRFRAASSSCSLTSAASTQASKRACQAWESTASTGAPAARAGVAHVSAEAQMRHAARTTAPRQVLRRVVFPPGKNITPDSAMHVPAPSPSLVWAPDDGHGHARCRNALASGQFLPPGFRRARAVDDGIPTHAYTRRFSLAASFAQRSRAGVLQDSERREALSMNLCAVPRSSWQVWVAGLRAARLPGSGRTGAARRSPFN
jgi:hypothetical protein